MKYRPLGRTGFNVSDIGYGLWGMSGWSGSEDEQSRAALRTSVQIGCNFFDSAWAYGNGKSDGFLGESKKLQPNCTEVRSAARDRSEEHTSELQSRPHLVCRL